MSKDNSRHFSFQKKNYLLMLAGLAVIIAGYALMSGGGSADPNVFDPSIFSERRITLAPIVVLIGYAFVGYAIMHKPRSSASQEQLKK